LKNKRVFRKDLKLGIVTLIPFLNKDFFKSLMLLVSGSAISMIISFLFQIILRRYYSPEVFGAFDIYLNIFNVIVSISVLKYDQAVILPSKEKDSVSLVTLSAIISFIVNAIFFIIIIFFVKPICSYFNISLMYSWWFFMLPLSAFLFSTFQSLNYWFIRKKAFRVSSVNKIYRRFGEGIVQSIIGYNGFSGGLVVGNVAGSFINAIVGFIKASKMSFFKLFRVNYTNLFELFKRYSHFPKYALASNVFSSLCAIIPFSIISMQFDTYHTGLYGLSRMLLFTPISIISISLGQVLLQRFAEKKSENKTILKEVLIITGSLLITTTIISIIISPWSDELITFLFGEKWINSGPLFSIMLISFVFQFSVSPVSVSLIVYEKLNLQTIWQTIYMISLAALFFFKYNSLEDFLWIMVTIDSICYILYLGLIYYIISKTYINTLIMDL